MAERREVGPGMYDDGEGRLVIIMPEVLEHLGWPNDEEHRLIITAIAEQLADQNRIAYTEEP